MFGQVIMYDLFTPDKKTICKTQEEVVEFINKGNVPTEFIGGQQIKPCFDIDWEIPKNQHFEEMMSLSKWCGNIQQVLKNPKQKLDIKIIERPKREKGDNIKHSYHFIVNKIRISPANLKTLIIDNALGNDKPFDQSIYRNGGLYPIYSYKKYNQKNKVIEELPQFVPIDMFKMKDMSDINIFDYCPSYIEEDFEDWDAKMKPVEINGVKYEDDDDDEEIEDERNNELNIEEIITKLSASRADNYDEWLNMMFCLMNIGDKLKMKRKKILELCQLFSSKCEEKYDEDDIDDKFYSLYNQKRGKGYRFKYLLDCLKKDNPDYYKEITKPKIQNYNKTKEMFEKQNFFLKKPVKYIQIVDEEPVFYKKQEFICLNEGIQFTTIKKKDKRRKNQEDEEVLEYFLLHWFKDADKRTYNNIVWRPPPLVTPPSSYNTFLPIRYSLMTIEPTKRDYWKEFELFANNLFGDEAITNYILARYAFRVQNPGLRSYVCVIYYGAEGDGKSQFINTIYSLFDTQVLDKKYSIQIDDAKKLYDTHSMFEYQKCLVCVNEAGGVANFQNADILKTRITENKINVNPKGIQSFEADNLVDYDMTTNNENVVKYSDDSSRRYFQVETTMYYSGNEVFWNDYLKNIIENPVALKQIYDGLMKFDVKAIIPSGNFQSKKDKPRTAVAKRVKQMNRDKVIVFLDEECDGLKDEITQTTYTNTELFSTWNYWCSAAKFNIEYNRVAFGMKIGNIGKKIEKAIGKVGIYKDTNSKTTIYPEVIKEYVEYLDNL